MIKGLHTAASSMLATRRQLNLRTDNLANVNTSGFKREEGIKESFPEMVLSRLEKGKTPRTIGSLGTGVRLRESYTDFSQGELKHTDNDLDLALKGQGMFVVETPEGEAYTRNGNFALNNQQQIVTQQGYPVLGEDGEPLQTINDREINIDNNGQLYLGGLEGNQFQIVDIPQEEALEKRGDNLYQVAEDVEMEVEDAEDYQVLQGYLEGSNVNIVKEMTGMIETNRLYEVNQKVIQNHDSTLDQAVNQVGRVRG
ncbi:MAG: flagellar basal-body rod protein FlgF [Bacillota bacterium]